MPNKLNYFSEVFVKEGGSLSFNILKTKSIVMGFKRLTWDFKI
jgi:hypothetical protein